LNKYHFLKPVNFKCSLVLFFLFSFCAFSCAQQRTANEFYLGLNDSERAVNHFEKALTNYNEYIQHAAANELFNLKAHGTELSAKTARRIQYQASGWLVQAFNLIENPDNEKLLNFIFGFEQEAVPYETILYIIRECEKKEVFLSGRELAAIEGHFAIYRLRYNEALNFFRAFMENENWPEQIPEIFIKYPVLINDFGRAFQYTSSGTQGLTLFSEWEDNLTYNTVSDVGDLRYRLLFFAARIARRNGRNAQAISLFERAMHFAPSGEQSDACNWYILDLSLNETSVSFIQKLEMLIPHWYDHSYFNDILERFLAKLVSAREWKNIIRVFNLIRDRQASMKSGYAWVIGRAIEDRFLSNEEMTLAAQAAGAPASVDVASVFMQIAYDAAENDVTSILYYRTLCASTLGRPIFEVPEETAEKGRNTKPSQALQFILGFFTNNAAVHAPRYISLFEQELSVDELRTVAIALEQAEMYIQSIQLVLRYIEREEYSFNRRDLELLFPRPYMELVEGQMAETGITPQMLFALIRTESAFQSGVVSHAGAVGLTQLMPGTALEMAGRIRRSGGPDFAALENGLDLKEPEQNIHIGAFYLNYLIGRFEDNLLSVLAYNGGMNRVRRWWANSSLPVDLFLETVTVFETRDYGRKVMAAAAVYEELYYRR